MDISEPSHSNPNLDSPDSNEGKSVGGTEGAGVAENMVDNVNNAPPVNNIGIPTPTDFNAYLTLVGELLRNETADPWERSEPTPLEQEMFDTHDEFVAELWEEIGKERGYGRTVEEGALGEEDK